MNLIMSEPKSELEELREENKRLKNKLKNIEENEIHSLREAAETVVQEIVPEFYSVDPPSWGLGVNNFNIPKDWVKYNMTVDRVENVLKNLRIPATVRLEDLLTERKQNE